MADQASFLSERLVAHLTLEGALTSVGPHVGGQAACLRKRLVADLTLEGSLTSVGPHVAGHFAFP